MTESEARDKAQELWADDDLTISDEAVVDVVDGGCWVEAYIFVHDEEPIEDEE